MKKCLKTKSLVGLVLLSVMVLASCSKDEENSEIQSEELITVAELKSSDEAEQISDEIINLGEDVYALDEIIATSKSDYNSDYLPDCVTITTVITNNSKGKTIDFGSGCELPNGNVLSGIIYLSYLKDMEMATKTLSLNLENFTFNGVEVQGSASVNRTRSNANGNPESVATWSFDGVWPTGETSSFSGNRTREWIEGYGSGFWGDNVFLISGKGTFTGRLGNVFIKEITVPLRREWSCRFIVSGILEISRNDATAILDFGDGSCDAKGILTKPDGSTEEIFLRRFKNR